MKSDTTNPTAVVPPASKSFTRYFPTIARVLMGLLFFVFGVAGLFNLIPPPKEALPEGAMAFSMAMMKTGYLFQLVKGTEITCGLLLLLNRFVPLALVLLAPVIINIVSFHVFLLPSGAPMAIVILALEIYLAWSYRHAYRPMLVARTVPNS